MMIFSLGSEIPKDEEDLYYVKVTSQDLKVRDIIVLDTHQRDTDDRILLHTISSPCEFLSVPPTVGEKDFYFIINTGSKL